MANSKGLSAGMAVLVLAMASCTTTPARDGDAASPVTAQPPTAPATAAPTVDEAARRMCGRAALAVAHHQAGNRVEETLAWGQAEAALLSSGVPQVKALYDNDDATTSRRIRAWCHDHVTVPKPHVRPTRRPVAAPKPSPTHEQPTTDPRFDTCKEANAAGYGPYVRGVDPEYDWYIDRDHDGRDCEP